MKKNFKRWLALMLAVVMVSGTFLSHTENFLQAIDEQAVEATQEETETVANETGDKIVEQNVQQPQPVEEKQEVEIPKQEEEKQEIPKGEEPKQEAPKAEEPKQEAPKAEEPKEESNQETPAEKVEKTFGVTFKEPESNGGTLRVWAEGEDKKEVSYNNGKYVKETKEDTTLYFEIETKDNYKLDQVKDEDGNVLKPESQTETTSTYKMVVEEDKQITTLYKEETPKEEPAEDEVQDDTSAASADERVASYSVEVGKTISIKGTEGRNHSWKVSSTSTGGSVRLTNTSKQTVTVEGQKAGTVKIKHTWGFLKEETFTVEVKEKATEPEIPSGTERVYLYMKMENPPKGWTQNDQAWYTIGYVDVAGIPAAKNMQGGPNHPFYPEYRDKVVSAVKAGKVVRFEQHANLNLDFSQIQWKKDGYGLKVADGASDYVPPYQGKQTWHLDGFLPKELKIGKVDIIGETAKKTYDGTEKTVTGFKTEGPDDIQVSLKENRKAEAKGTDAGKYPMNLSPHDFEATGDGYAVININIKKDGLLTIEPIKEKQTVTITGYTDTVTYNGREQKVIGYDVKAPAGIDVSLKEGVTARAAGTDAGTYPMGLTKDSFNVTSKNYSNIEVIVNDGWLKIDPITDEVDVVVTGNNNTVDYNGQEQEVTGFTTNAPTGVTVSLKNGKSARAAGTDAGTYYMNLKKEDFEVSSKNYSNVKITNVIDGWLKINKSKEPVNIQIYGNHNTVTYNGTEQEVTGFTTSALPEGVTVALAEGATARAAGTNAQEEPYKMGLKVSDFVATSKNHESIRISVAEDGWLKINPIKEELVVNVKGKTADVDYTGSEQIVTGFDTDVKDESVTIALKEGKEAVAKGTNAQEERYMMGLTAEDFIATSPNYTNIKVQVTDGWLKINPTDKELVVNVKGKTKTTPYTGNTEFVEGFEVLNAPDDVTVALKEGSTARAEGIDADTYYMGLTAEDFTATSPNYTNIKVQVEDGWLKIEPKDTLIVEVTGNNAEKDYNGNEQKVEGFTTNAPKDVTVELKKDHKAEAKGTNVGTYYMGLDSEDFTATSKNYKKITISIVKDGFLTITPITKETVVEIKGNTDTKPYTGVEQKVEGFRSNAEKIDKTIKVELANGSSAIAKGTVVGTYNMNLAEDDFVLSSPNYTNLKANVTDGWLKIDPTEKPLEVTITGNSAEEVYNGNEQSVTGFTSDAPENVEVKLASGRSAVASGTTVGTYMMGLTEEDFIVSSPNYTNITTKVVDGKLEITPITEELTVTITGKHDSLEYTGKEQKVEGYEHNAPTNVSVELAEGKEAVAKGTVVGHYEMGLTKDSFKVTSDNYSNIVVEVVDGYLDITPLTEEVTVKVTGNHDSLTYNGKEQSVTGFTTNAEEIDKNKTIKVELAEGKEAVAKGTVAGHYEMGLTKDSFKATSDNYSNIAVEVVDGYLDITPIEEKVTVKVTGNHDSLTYNGEEQSVTGFTTNAEEIDKNKTIKVELAEGKEAEAKGTVAGHYEMGLTKDSFKVTSANYSNIAVEVVDGYLDITPIEEKVTVKVTGNHDSLPYNGKEQSVTGFTTNAEEIDKNKTIKVELAEGKEAVAKGTVAGHYEMGLTKDSFKVTSANYSNIAVEVVDGYLDITPVQETLTVTITGESRIETYNGNPWTVSGYVHDAPANVNVKLADGVKAEATGTEAGNYPMGLTKDSFEVTSENYSNIDVVVVDGYLLINPADTLTVHVKGTQENKEYNGQEQSVTGFKDDAPDDVEITLKEGIKAEAKGTTVDKYPMNLDKEDFEVKADNYQKVELVVEDGWLNITPITEEVTVKVTGNHNSLPYNGEEQRVTGFTTNADTIDQTIKVELAKEAEAKGTVVGTYKMGLQESDFTATSPNYTNLKVDVTDGYLEITPITTAITLKADDANKVYDGTALTKETFSHDGQDVLVNGDKLTAVVEGSKTNAGTSDNKITSHKVVRTIEGKTVDVTNCYSFKPYETGTLTVKKRPITVEAGSQTKTFDGMPLVNDGYQLTEGTLAEGQNEKVTVEGSQLYVGSSPNVVKDVKIYAADNEEVTPNYEITPVNGTLTVTDGSGEIPVDPDQVVTKTHEYKTYGLGDTIKFTIEVTNIYDEPKTITVVEQEGVTITGQSVFEDVAPGAVVTTTAEYVVTEKDILAGNFTNKVTAKFEGEKDFSNTDEVTDLEDPNGHLTVTKETTSKPANNVSYVLGEKITYKITVTNDGNLTITDIIVNDELTGNTGENAWTIESLAPGKSQEFTAEYVVTEEDLLKGSVKNVAVADGISPDPEVPEVPVTPGEKEDPTDKADPSLFVEKTAELKEDGTPFGLGEQINYTIKVVNNGNLTVKDITVEDDLTGEKWTIESLEPKAEKTFDTTYDVTERDLVAGEVHNVATATGTAADPKTKQTVKASDDETVATVEAKAFVDIVKEITTTPENEDGYALNEVIGYKITATNTGNQTLKNVVVKDDLTGDEWTIETLAPGQSETFTTKYTVTEKDILAGKVVNVATATGDNTNPEGPEPEVDPGETETETEEEKPSFTADKKLTNEGTGADGKFKVGEEAKFDIVVKNTGNVTLKNVIVEEQLAGATIVAGEGYTVSADGKTATIDTLAVNATVTVKAVYEVTQEDVDNGGAVNSVAVEGEGSGETDPEPVDPEEQIPTEDPKPDFESSKELTNSGSGTYGAFKVGETAKFAITVKNTGNVTLKNLTVKEQLAGAKVVAGTGYTINADGVAVIDTLEVDATVVVNAEYQITQEDVDNGKLVNTVAVEGEGPNPIDPENPDPDPEEPEVEIPTDPHAPTALTDKTLTNAGSGENGSFKAGETATFDITVKNTGNVTLKNVVVREMLEGAKIVAGTGYEVSADGKVATIARIGVGETATVKAEYVVTQKDVDNGGTRNMATVDIPGETDPQPPTEEIPTDPQKPEMTSEKVLTNEGTGENGAFEVGDVAEFDITVENTGNVTLNNITVKEQLAGAKVVEGEGYKVSGDGTEATIDTLEVGKVIIVKAEYEITQEDVDNGGAVNRVIVEGEGPENPDPEKPTPDPKPVDPEEPIPTPDPNPDMNVEKTITSNQEIYRVGDRITYQITVENTGNVTLHDVVVEDTLQNAAGEVTFEKTEGVTFEGNTAIIGTMAPGQTVTLNASYVVTREDAGSDISNVAIGTSEETPDPDVDETPVTPTEDLYNLTINYVYADGRTAAPSVRAQYLEGETFSYASPAIAGYTPDYAFVRTSAAGMPASDVVITITYTANVAPTPDTPDGGDDGTTTPGTDGTTDPAAPTEPTAEETVGAEVRATDDGEVEVVPVVEEEVPLANRDLDNHECCILHFLLMLAAMVVYAMYTRSMKKRQARIAELAEELETEMLKREQQSEE